MEVAITMVIVVAAVFIIYKSVKSKASGDCGCGSCSSKGKCNSSDKCSR